MVDVYEYLGRSVRKSYEVDADIGKISDELILPGGFDERISVHVNAVKGIKHFPDLNNSFILGHSVGGVLGTSKLGLGSDSFSKLFFVYNGENSYYETFNNLDYINTGSTTATIETGSGIIIGDGEEYWTNPIVYSELDYCTAARINMKTSNYNLDETKIYMRNNPSNDWEQFILDESNNYNYFNAEGSQLEIKFVTENSISQNHITIDSQKVLFTVEYLTENYRDIFYEYGENDVYYDLAESKNMIIDANIINPSFRFDLPSSEYVSKEIPLKNTYGNVIITLGSYTNGNVQAYISNDSKATWTVLPENTSISLDFNTTDNAYIKFINDSTNSITSNTFTDDTPYFDVIFQSATGTGSDVTLYRNDDGELYKLIFTR